VRIGLLALAAGALVMVAGIDPGADASVVTIPMILLGCGMGALASQLGAVTVSAVPDERSAEVGGVQNTATNLGASLGTALIGSILIASLTATFITGIQNNPAVPPQVSTQASTQLASGIPFVSEADLAVALESAAVPDDLATEIVQEYSGASLAALRASMAAVAFFALVALFVSERIPTKAVGAS
jgi:MFS family permease